MANKDFNQDMGDMPAKPKRGPATSSHSVNEKTANWGGLPGKAGPDRSDGVQKVKQSPKSEGL